MFYYHLEKKQKLVIFKNPTVIQSGYYYYSRHYCGSDIMSHMTSVWATRNGKLNVLKGNPVEEDEFIWIKLKSRDLKVII